MKFKKVLAATLAAALVVTGGGFSNLALLGTEAVYAADEPYSVAFSSRTTTSTSDTLINLKNDTNETDIDVAYGDEITLSAKLSRNVGSTATTKEEVFDWRVYDSGDNLVNVNGVNLTSTKDSITFKATKDIADDTYVVKVKVSQIYELNGSASIQSFSEKTIKIDVVKKELSSSEVLSSVPEFNNVYVSYTADKTLTETTALATLLKNEDGTGSSIINGTYGSWKATKIGDGSDNKLTAKDYTVELTFTPSANYKAKAGDSGWTGSELKTTKTLTVKSATQHVTKVDMENIKTVKAGNNIEAYDKSKDVLVYNSTLSSDQTYGLDDIKLQIGYTADAPVDAAISAKPNFVSSDKSKVEVVDYDSSTKILTLRAIGAAAGSTEDVTITAYDSAGSALASGNAFQIHVYKGVQESELSFATNVPTSYEYTGGHLSDVFDYKALNAVNQAEGATPEQKKYLYTATVSGNAISDNDSTTKLIKADDTIKFTGYYALDNNERIITKSSGYTQSEGKPGTGSFDTKTCLIKDYTAFTVDKKIITKDYIEKAIEAITLKIGGEKLSGNTGVNYGTTLTSASDTGLNESNDYSAITLLDYLYYLDTEKNTYVKVKDGSYDIKTPAVGARSYVFLINADTAVFDNSCRIGATAFGSYPISFTVKETTLKLKDIRGSVGTDKVSYASADAISGSIQLKDNLKSVYLYTEQQSYDKVADHYTFEYVWTDSKGTVLNPSDKKNPKLTLQANTSYNGTYTCTVTATPISGKSGQLGTLTASASANVYVSDMKVLVRTTESNGTVKYTGDDLGVAPAALKHIGTDGITSGNATYVTPASLNVGVIAESGYTMNATTVSIKDAVTKETKESKLFEGSNNEYTTVEWLLPQLSKGSYEIWLESSSTKGTTTHSYNKKIYDYTVDAFADANVSLSNDANYKLTSTTDKIEYGKKPSEVLSYEFKLDSASITAGKFTTTEVELINQLIKDNYNIAIKTSSDKVYNVAETNEKVILTITKKSSASADVNMAVGDTTNKKLGNFKIVKKELKLTPVKDSYKWTLGASDNEEISAEFSGFVSGQNATSVGLANAIDYDIVDKDGKVITISNIGAGEYTVKFKSTEEPANYSVNTDATATLIVEEQKSPLTGITADDITLKVGDSKKITVSQVPTTAADVDTTKLTYKSDDEDIVAVDASGNATAKANGKTTIKVTYTDADNEIEYTTTINVTVSSSTETYTKEDIDKVASENATLKEEAQKAQEAAEEAQKTASAEAQKAAAAQEAKEQAEKEAAAAVEAKEQAEKEAAEAKEAADKAAKEAATAQTTATDAKAAQEKAEAAQKTAEAAAATAKTAQKKAEAAQKTAEATATAAKAAQTKAKTAQKAAETAQKAAEKKAAAAVAVKKGDIFVVGKNIYKITNVSKKTASFVGTYTTGKSVTIAATAKNSKNGVTYKVTAIAASALKGNKTITKVTIGKNVTTIGKNAFSGCSKLKTVTIKSSKIKTVKTGAFKIAKKAKVKVPSAKVKAYKKLFKKAGLPSTATVSK